MDTVSSMLDLIRRLQFTKIEEYVEALIQLSPDYADDLSGNVDQPLKLRVDSATGEEYIACVYNQDGESHWSPWSNEYDPSSEDGPVPPPKLRKLETAMNIARCKYLISSSTQRSSRSAMTTQYCASLRHTYTP